MSISFVGPTDIKTAGKKSAIAKEPVEQETCCTGT